jgi:hypothetical protein
VTVAGLAAKPQFNGKIGVVESFVPEAARFSVLLTTGASSGQSIKVRVDNLRLCQTDADNGQGSCDSPFDGAAAAGSGDARRLEWGGPGGALQPGARVALIGLQSSAGRKINGQLGVVQHCAEDTGRWSVTLDTTGAAKMFKEGNLAVDPPSESGATGEHIRAVLEAGPPMDWADDTTERLWLAVSGGSLQYSL